MLPAAPPGTAPAPPEALQYGGSVTLRCSITRTGVGVVTKRSGNLPYPAVLRQVTMWGAQVGTGGAQTVIYADLTNDTGDRASGLPPEDYDVFGTWPLNGTGDFLNDDGGGYVVENTTAPVSFDTWLPVPGADFRLRVMLKQNTAINPRVTLSFTFWKLRTAIPDPGEGIVPRGTPDEPVCVRICGAEGPQPPTPPPPPPPSGPPVAPPPGGGGGYDPTTPPFPEPCSVDPFNPWNATALPCTNARGL
jgi:hypothetical protein